MTDNRTTELREKLTERGVKWTSKPTRPETTWAYDGWWYNAKFEPWSDSTFKVTIYDITPEQAIAATLGSDRESELQSALNKAAGNWAKADALLRERTSGTLTAEQVEIAINNHCQFTVGCVVDAQAIADELNARAERTCYAKPHLNLTIGKDFLTQNGMDCSECGGRLDLPVRAFYCPNCGAKVRDE